MTAKLKVGVVGVGHLGQYHAQKYAGLPDTDLVGVVDADPGRAAEIAGRYGTRVFTDLPSLLAAVDAVSVAVPTSDHFRVGSLALEAGVHVLLEKPIAATPDEAERLVALAAARALVLQIGHLERFNPAFTAAVEEIREPRFIEVHRLSPFTFRSVDIDVVLDLMIHDLDLVLSLVRSPIREVFAVGVPVLSERVDIANVRLHFVDGTVCNLTASRVSLNRERKLRVFQLDSYFSVDFANFTLVQCRRKEIDYYDPIPRIDFHKKEFPAADSLKLEIADFVASVCTGRPPVVSGSDGLAALQAAWRIKETIALQETNADGQWERQQPGGPRR
ncbi:MAG: Gfo/Idh/MocA family oxidoreductase [Deltaproteobacteria bacterium]|nr:Gfo/Idh/MocA family oxidoreductase [Candidatus Anaeroferrophillacea bacterium]